MKIQELIQELHGLDFDLLNVEFLDVEREIKLTIRRKSNMVLSSIPPMEKENIVERITIDTRNGFEVTGRETAKVVSSTTLNWVFETDGKRV